MRNLVTSFVLLSLILPSALVAEVVVRDSSQETVERRAAPTAAGAGGLVEKFDPPSDTLIVPYYEVDTTDPAGTTTLFAVRNVTGGNLTIEVEYLTVFGDTSRQDVIVLGAWATLTRNLRDVAGLPVDPDGFARGIVLVTVDSPAGNWLVGDYLQVDVGNNFATGDRLLAPFDLCEIVEIRFLDFGGGTDLHVLLEDPQGANPEDDPPSFYAHFLTEDGATVEELAFFTDQHALSLNTSDLIDAPFGTIIFGFSNSSEGTVIAEYSADGKFSVGMNGVCNNLD